MKFTNGIRIATANKSLCGKTLLSKLIILIIGFISVLSVASVIVKPIFYSVELGNIGNTLRNLIKDFILMNSVVDNSYGATFKLQFTELFALIKSLIISNVWVVVVIFLIIEFLAFIMAIVDYVIGINLNEHMSSICHAGFFNTLFENFKMACRYAGFKILVLLIANAVTLTLAILLFIVTIDTLGIFAFTLAVFILFAFNSIRLTLTGLTLPNMILDNVSAFKAFKQSFKGLTVRSYFSRFVSYFLVSVLIYISFVLGGIITFGVAILLIYPLSCVSVIAVKFVDSYTIRCKKYYITFDDIVIPKELRQNDEQLLNQVEI